MISLPLPITAYPDPTCTEQSFTKKNAAFSLSQLRADTSPRVEARATAAHVTHRSDHYDDPDFNYADWWQGREYEHQAEVIAIRRLLHGRRFGHAIDVGGGFGRLSVVLADYADQVTLVDASLQQLELSRDFLARHPAVSSRQMAAAELKLPDASTDLVAMIRVMHHLPDPAAVLAEVSRILRPGGNAIIEAANTTHAVNRVRYLLRREQIPASAVDMRSDAARRGGGIPYVNHHPDTVARQLEAAGLHVRCRLSVSNLRHPLIKKVLPKRVMLAVEQAAQERLARISFGPSMFFLLEK
jgi:SAM-dependent methyltransferase